MYIKFINEIESYQEHCSAVAIDNIFVIIGGRP